MNSYTASLILLALRQGYAYGFDIMQATGLASGTIYPALRRMERNGFVRSRWEDEAESSKADRPARRYYTLTQSGHEALETAEQRYKLPELAPAE